MATLAPTKISSTSWPRPAHNRVDLNFYRWNEGSAVPDHIQRYVHLKTNFPRYGGQMYMIEVVGYNYDLAQAIRCAFTGYMYDDGTRPGQTIYNPTQFQAYPGLTAHGQYLSSDNFLVLRVTAAGLFFAGFELNCYQVNPVSSSVSPQITAVAQNTTSGVHF